MKRLWTAIGILISAAAAMAATPDVNVRSIRDIPIRFGMPETGVAPSHLLTEFTTRMEEPGGTSHLTWSAYRATIPLLDPRKSQWGSWRINACVDMDAVVLHTDGSLNLRRDELFTFSLPVTFIHFEERGNNWALGVGPGVCTDFATAARVWNVIAFTRYSVHVSDTFDFNFGLAVSPRFVKNTVVPIAGFTWTPTPDWQIRVDGFKVDALYRVNERLQLGPVARMSGGCWMVNTEEGNRIFRINSVVSGLTAEYDFHTGDQPKRIIYATLGAILSTRADFCERTSDMKHYETHHYKPGVYASLGVDFRF